MRQKHPWGSKNRKKGSVEDVHPKTDTNSSSSSKAKSTTPPRDRKPKAHPWSNSVASNLPQGTRTTDDDDDLSVVELARAALGQHSEPGGKTWGSNRKERSNDALADSAFHDSMLSEYTLNTYMEYDPTTTNTELEKKKPNYNTGSYTDAYGCDMSICDASLGYLPHVPLPEHHKEDSSVAPSVAATALDPVLEQCSTEEHVKEDESSNQQQHHDDNDDDDDAEDLSEIKEGDDVTHCGESSRCSRTTASNSAPERNMDISCRVLEEVENEFAEEEAMMAHQQQAQANDKGSHASNHDGTNSSGSNYVDVEEESLALDDILKIDSNEKIEKRRSSSMDEKKKSKEQKHSDSSSKEGSTHHDKHDMVEPPASENKTKDEYNEKMERRSSGISKKKKSRKHSDSSAKEEPSRNEHTEAIEELSILGNDDYDQLEKKEKKKKKKKDRKHSDSSSKEKSTHNDNSSKSLSVEDIMNNDDHEMMDRRHSSLTSKKKKKKQKDHRLSDSSSREDSLRHNSHEMEEEALAAEEMIQDERDGMGERRSSTFTEKKKKKTKTKKERKPSDASSREKSGESSESLLYEDVTSNSHSERASKRNSSFGREKENRDHRDLSPKAISTLDEGNTASEAANSPDFEDIMNDFFGEEAEEIVSSSKKKKKKKERKLHQTSKSEEDSHDFGLDFPDKNKFPQRHHETSELLTPNEEAPDWNSKEFDEWTVCDSVSGSIPIESKKPTTLKTSSKDRHNTSRGEKKVNAHHPATSTKGKLQPPPIKPPVARIDRTKDNEWGKQLFVVQARRDSSGTENDTKQQSGSNHNHRSNAQVESTPESSMPEINASGMPHFFVSNDNDQIEDLNEEHDRKNNSKKHRKKLNLQRFVPKLTPMKEEFIINKHGPTLLDEEQNKNFDMTMLKEPLPTGRDINSCKMGNKKISPSRSNYRRKDDSAIDDDGFFLASDDYSVTSFRRSEKPDTIKTSKHNECLAPPGSSRDSEKKNDELDAFTAERRGTDFHKLRGSHDFY